MPLIGDSIPQALRGEYLHVRHPRQDPAHQFLASRGFQPHFDPPVGSRTEFLRWVPLPLGDVDRQFQLEEESDLDGLLAAGDAKRLSGVGLGVEVGGAGESPAEGIDPPGPR